MMDTTQSVSYKKIVLGLTTAFLTIVAFSGIQEIRAEEASNTNNASTSVSHEEMEKELDALRDQIDALKSDVAKQAKKDDTKFSCKLGGQFFLSSAMIANQNSVSRQTYGDIPNEFGISDLRLTARGEGYDNLSYECTIGFNDTINLKDVGVKFKELPVLGDLQLGHYKIDSGMGYSNGIYDTEFMDFNTNVNTFRVGRRLGVRSFHYFFDKRIMFNKSVFVGRSFDEDTFSVVNDDAGIILNTRLTGLPLYRETTDGNLDELLHVGGSFYWSDPNGSYRERVRPTGWTGSMPYLATGKFDLTNGKSYSVSELELAWQKRGFGLIGEAYAGSYSDHGNAYGVSTTARYMLTSNCYHTYNKDLGCFAGVSMPENVSLVDFGQRRIFENWGAWELAMMWSYTDLNDLESTPGALYGTVNELIGGLVWYWNPQMKMSFNWIHSMADTALAGKEKRDSVIDTVALQLKTRF